MNRKKIDFAPSFLRKAGKLLKRNPSLKESYNIFSLYDDIIYLLDIGSHDDVY